ncbi:hypothetical protein GCM10010172_81000 [Paractinoplanes ferrugineus]|uniref:PilZ domain-containing protein n=1 Tax=Paractinoplanes ferrugineus TaxID=113564 RepID=A0A919IWM8_9ACTN|nr:hypothetical protein [Actinoplanes ferrugineus]GIE10421.1 hypothetical protein Afe05nite_22610 [Actinoplanes ferrugineus]
MIAVPAGTTLTLRCQGEPDLPLMSLAQVRADFVTELPPIMVLSLDEPGTRRYGILELVTSAGVTWVEAELRDGRVTVTGGLATDVVQRRGAPRRPGTYPATGTAQVDSAAGRKLVAVSGHVEDVSTGGLLLRASGPDSPHLPRDIERALLHVAMPWGVMTAALKPVEQIADQLRGTYEWLDPADSAALREFCP